MTINRITTWKGPTGRTLTTNTEFKVKGKRGRWRFIAYVDSTHPHIEAVEASTSRGGNVRCFDPSLIYSVSRSTGEST